VDVAWIRDFVRVAIGVAGALSIYRGYRLFCRPNARLMNGILGALLAVMGMGILTAEIRGIGRPRTTESAPVHRTKPVGTGRHKPSGDWLV